MLPLVYDLYNHAFEGFSSSSSCFHLCQKTNKHSYMCVFIRVPRGILMAERVAVFVVVWASFQVVACL